MTISFDGSDFTIETMATRRSVQDDAVDRPKKIAADDYDRSSRTGDTAQLGGHESGPLPAVPLPLADEPSSVDGESRCKSCRVGRRKFKDDDAPCVAHIIGLRGDIALLTQDLKKLARERWTVGTAYPTTAPQKLPPKKRTRGAPRKYDPKSDRSIAQRWKAASSKYLRMEDFLRETSLRDDRNQPFTVKTLRAAVDRDRHRTHQRRKGS